MNRRRFLKTSAVASAASALPTSSLLAAEPIYKISLAQWSLHKLFFAKEGDPLHFAKMAKQDYGIEAVEYVNQFYKEKVGDKSYLADLKKVQEDNGVKGLLIMCDGLGNLGDSDEAKRKQAVENHRPMLEWAKFLGCHSIRVNAASDASLTPEEQEKLAADGLGKLAGHGKEMGLNVIVENHGGLSSNGSWLAAVMKRVGMPNCGTLPDFGNFRIGPDKEYDRYKGVEELMPFAKGVSAKSHDFDEAGNEIHTDYVKMMKIVLAAGYKGHVGIEYEGSKISEPDGIKATKKLLESVRSKLAA